MILIGHAGHPEVEGTHGPGLRAGHAGPDGERRRGPARSRRHAGRLHHPDDAERRRHPGDHRGARTAFQRHRRARTRNDICYATQNRQWAVRELCKEVDVILVVGAKNSSNSNRLCEIATQVGISGLSDRRRQRDPPDWVDGVHTVGVTAGASAPEELVSDVIRFASLRPVEISTLNGQMK